MPQFVVPKDGLDLDQARAVLRGAEARHCAAVLRCGPGDPVWLTDGRGHRWRGLCTTTGGGEVHVEQLQALAANEPATRVELLHGLPKGERWDAVLEKGTELGVAVFRPLLTERSVPKLAPERLEKRLTRWRDKVRAALKQCERALLPQVEPPQPLTDCLRGLGPQSPGELRLYMAERSASAPWPGRAQPEVVRIAVGPEGGWSAVEQALLSDAGFRPVSLGPRVLRTDTAAVAAVTLALHRWGDLVSVDVG